MKRTFLASLLAVASVAQVSAHQVWIEDSPEGKLVVRFGEFGEEFEKSPGALDNMSAPAAFTLEADGKAKLSGSEKKSDHFAIADLSAKSAVLIETGFNVRGGGDKPASRSFFYSRWQPLDAGAGKPSLTFDLVPTGKPGEVKVIFRGQAVPSAKVTAFLPGKEEKELTADANGVVQVSTEKPGFYLLVGKGQREAQNGFWNGRAYETVSHSTSIAWRVSAK